MPNNYFRFKQFTVLQDGAAMKVCTDACLFGAWAATLIDNSADRILDIGTGTGLLSLMIAQKTNSNIDAVEIDEQAYLQAKDNFGLSPWSERLKAVHSSIQQFESPEKYDFIISNPPFYENDLQSEDEKRNLALHSSALELAVLFVSIKKLLKPKKQFAILLPYKRSREFEELVTKNECSLIQKISVKHTDSHPHFRSMYLVANGKSNRDPLLEEAIIKTKEHEYSERFYDLLSDYYLFKENV